MWFVSDFARNDSEEDEEVLAQLDNYFSSISGSEIPSSIDFYHNHTMLKKVAVMSSSSCCSDIVTDSESD